MHKPTFLFFTNCIALKENSKEKKRFCSDLLGLGAQHPRILPAKFARLQPGPSGHQTATEGITTSV